MNPVTLAAASVSFPTTYIGVALWLYLTGVGLPFPEEATLVIAGAVLYGGAMEWGPLVAVALAGIIAADIQVYVIGRFFGRRLVAKKFFHFLLPPDRIQRAEKRFAGHFLWAVATVRFMSGLRGPTYFTAGMLRMPFLKFVVIDIAAACVHVAVFTTLGYLFSPHLERIIEFIKKADRWMGISILIALVSLALFIGYWMGLHRRKK